MKTINNTRLINRKTIIEYILFSKEPVSQNDLLNSLNLDNSTIKRICDTLIKDGILNEETVKLPGKGRRPKAYSINSRHKQIACLVLGSEKTQVFNYTLDLKLKSNDILYYGHSLPFEEKLSKVINYLKTVTTDIFYIVTSGLIDNTNRKLLRHYRFDVQNINISEYFEQHLNTPTFAENNMNAFAINYLYSHNPAKLKDFAVLSCEQGLGAGFILDGDLYRGHQGNAGEIGHLFYQQSTSNCYCKRNGCIEMFLSTKYFKSHNIDIASISDWEQLKMRDIKLASKIFNDFATYASHLLRNLDVTLNINTVFVSGLIFQILMDQEFTTFLTNKLNSNQIDAKLILVPSDERNFHYGGAILASRKLLGI